MIFSGGLSKTLAFRRAKRAFATLRAFIALRCRQLFCRRLLPGCPLPAHTNIFINGIQSKRGGSGGENRA